MRIDDVQAISSDETVGGGNRLEGVHKRARSKTLPGAGWIRHREPGGSPSVYEMIASIALAESYGMPNTLFTSSIEIKASPEVVWNVLVDREKGRVWRGADFETDWQLGSPITITAEIGPKRYRDKGKVLGMERPSLLAFEFLSRVSGLPDVPENYSREPCVLRQRHQERYSTLSIPCRLLPSGEARILRLAPTPAKSMSRSIGEARYLFSET